SFSFSSGPSNERREIGKSNATSASAKAVRASGNFSERSRPMPAYWEPCPGNRKATFMTNIPLLAEEGWMRRAKRRRRRGGQDGETSPPNRPPRRFAPPLLAEEGNDSHERNLCVRPETLARPRLHHFEIMRKAGSEVRAGPT